MALAKRPSRAQPTPEQPKSRALQFSDISPGGQRSVSAMFRPLGNVRRNVPVRREVLAGIAANPSNNPRTRLKAEQRGRALEAMHEAGAFANKPITLAGAAQSRVDLIRAGAQRHHAEGVETGGNWYFMHHGRLADVAQQTGIHKAAVIAASASMSPQNAPDQEYAAVKALAHAHSNPDARITVRPGASKALGNPELEEYEGRALHPKHFTPNTLAALSEPKARLHADTQHVDLGEIAKGGVKSQVSKAIDVLRGNIAPDKAINPRTAPKVWSYHENISQAVPGSAEHMEFLSRAHNVGTQIPGQQRLDITGLKESREGILSPTGHTAEDSWMHAINTEQQLAPVDIPGRTGRASAQSPAKFIVGEGGGVNEKALRLTDARRRTIVKGTTKPALEHAWSNQATQMAAQTLGEQHGEHVPAVAVQTLAWHEARRQAGKDQEYEAMRAGGDTPRQEIPGQGEMLTPRGRVRPEAKPPVEFRQKLAKRGQGQQLDLGF